MDAVERARWAKAGAKPAQKAGEISGGERRPPEAKRLDEQHLVVRGEAVHEVVLVGPELRLPVGEADADDVSAHQRHLLAHRANDRMPLMPRLALLRRVLSEQLRLYDGMIAAVASVTSITTKVRMLLGASIDYLLYELRFGVDTRGLTTLPEHDEHSRFYKGARWRLLHQCLPRDRLCPDDVFLDAGCGKGRMVVQAARLYAFRRIVGFDFSEQLIGVAKANVAKTEKHLRCHNIELISADAARYAVPDDVTIAYVYNSFAGDILAHFTNALIESFERRPRRLWLLYVAGLEYEMVENTGRFQLVSCRQRSARGPDFRLYELIAPYSPR